MSSVSKNMDQAVDELINAYTAIEQNETADTSPGTVNRDIIDAVADLTSQAFNDIEQTRISASLKNVALVSTDALSQIGLSFDVPRLASTTAFGIVFFQKKSVPTANIDFPAGTIVQTQKASDGTVTQFITLAAANLNPTTPFNPANRLYETSVAIMALVSGSDGNVGPGSINSLATPNRNIDYIANKDATTGGTDLEDATAYATRILAKTAGSDLGTAGGYKEAIEAQFPTLIDVAVAGPGDPALVRAQFGNEADVYLVGQSFSTFTDIVVASGQATDLLITHPVFGLTSVIGTTNGIPYQVGTDVVLVRDTGPVFGGSSKAFDKVQWLTTNRPGPTQKFSATGIYDASVALVQAYLDRDDVRYVTLDILAKAANRVGIVMQTSVISQSGYDRTSLAASVLTAVQNGLTNYTLGQDVFQSSLVNIIGSVPGVDEVTIPFTQLRRTTDTPGTVNDVIAIGKGEYARVDAAIFTVS